MTAKSINHMKVVAVAGLAMLLTSCGEFVRESRSPAQLLIRSLQGSSGAAPGEFGGTLSSDVLTIVTRTINDVETQVPTVFGDIGQVTMELLLRDPGQPGSSSSPSQINQVTINRYRVTYLRSDGRNTPGVDVPFPFDSAATFTVPQQGTITAGFDLVRVVAKSEAPLRNLIQSPNLITTIAEITFYGHDQAGNEVSTTGMIGITFGDFGDPE